MQQNGGTRHGGRRGIFVDTGIPSSIENRAVVTLRNTSSYKSTSQS